MLTALSLLVACGGGGDDGSGSTPPWVGTKQFGTTANDVAHGITTDTSGNIYLTGYTDGKLDGKATSGGSDLFIVKYDSSGVKQWTRQLGTAMNDVAAGIATDASGNVYVTGYTNRGLDGNDHIGSQDIFVVKYDNAGVKQWTQQLGTLTSDVARGIATDTSGNVYVTGYTDGNLDVNPSSGAADIFVVKYNSAGNQLWIKQLGTTETDFANGITTDTSGNVYLTGFTQGGLDVFANNGSNDIFVVKYDNDGNQQWIKQLGTAETDFANGITADASGNVYVTGYTTGDLDGIPHIDTQDIFLVKYDSAGNQLWIKQFGTELNDQANGATTDASGNIYVTGYTNSSLDGNTSSGAADIFVVKYNSVGEKQWTRQLGTAGTDIARGTATDASGNVYIAGETTGGLDGNTSSGGVDMFVVKYNNAGVKQ